MKVFTFILLLAAVATPVMCESTSTVPTTSPTGTSETTKETTVVSSSKNPDPDATTSVSPQDSSSASPVGSSTKPTNPSSSVSPSAPATTISPTAPAGASTSPPSTTTLPQVDVSYADFQRTCKPLGDCIYEYRVPQNSPQFLATERSLLDQEQQNFNSLSTDATAEETKFNNILQTPLLQLNDLKNRVQQAQNTLQLLTDLLDKTETNQRFISGNLTLAQRQLNQLKADRTSCTYQACFQPTTPTTTTVTTQAPTTTMSPCLNEEPQQYCKDTCAVDNYGPYCTSCHGNLDGHKFCLTSVAGTRIPCDWGMFVAPDYDTTSSKRSDGSVYSPNTLMSWLVTEANATINGDITLSIVSPTTLTVTAIGSDQQQLINSQRVLKAIFSLYDGPYLIELKTGSSNDTASVFAFNLTAR